MSGLADPAALLQRCRIVVCVGTGGVGKTTVAACIALEAARRGKRALVLTIDPARRLGDALGVDALGNEPTELAAERREALGIGDSGRLYAVMLDMKRTFDDLVERFADSEATRERVLSNPIYQHVSDALAGSGEYAAMEKVYELCEGDRYDVIVVDTPPSQHALDFLEAPQRLIEFLDSRIVQMLLHPAFAAGRFGFRIFQRTARRTLQLIERVSGIAFLEDVSEFLLAFEGMAEGFRERAHRVRSLLLGPEAGFVLVAGPSPEAAQNALGFLDHLERSRVPVAGVVVNRMRLWHSSRDGRAPETLRGETDLGEDCARLADALVAAGEADRERAALAAQAAVAAAKGYASLVELDLQSTAPLRRRAESSGRFYRRIPELSRDVHDLDGLLRVAGSLFGSEPDAAGEAGERGVDAATQQERAVR